jgi:hypothetical protein
MGCSQNAGEPKILYKITFRLCDKVYIKQMNYMVTLTSHPQDTSLSICIYSKIFKKLESEILLVPSILDKEDSTCIFIR